MITRAPPVVEWLWPLDVVALLSRVGFWQLGGRQVRHAAAAHDLPSLHSFAPTVIWSATPAPGGSSSTFCHGGATRKNIRPTGRRSCGFAGGAGRLRRASRATGARSRVPVPGK